MDRNWQNERRSGILQFMNTQTMTNLECSLRIRILEPFENNLPNVAIVYPGHLCTFVRRGIGLCHGDSGSPLITRDGIIAVTVGGVLLCARGGPDMFIRVSSYSGWIDSYIHDLN
jgi:hypothetical protein